MAPRNDVAGQGTSIFRRASATEGAAAPTNININRQNSKESSDGGTAFFVVDVDMTSQGDILCEEVSHLSDPTSYMLTTPIHTRAPPPRGKSQRQLSGGANPGRRRLSAKHLLKKPLAAIIRNHYFGHSKSKQPPRLENQPAITSSKRRKNHRSNSIVSPVVEETSSKESPQLSRERVPLTLLVPLGGDAGAVDNHNYIYRTISNLHEDEAAENRDPTASPNHHRNSFYNSTKQRDKPDAYQQQYHNNNNNNTSLELHRNPTLSWDDDHLLLFDDNQTATPRTPLGLGAAAASSSRQFSRSYGSTNTAPTASSAFVGKQSTTKSSGWISRMIGSIKNGPDNGSKLWMHSIFAQWSYVAIGIATILLLIAAVCGVPLGSSSRTSVVDYLYWAVTSFTTIGPVGPSETSSNSDTVSTPSMLMMVLTAGYALLGVTTMGVVWGRHCSAQLQQCEERRKQQLKDRQRKTLDVFCGPSHRGRNSPTRLSVLRFSGISQQIPVGHARMLIEAISLFVVTMLLMHCSEWTMSETMYHAVLTACTVGESGMEAQTRKSKILMLAFIPLVLFVTLRWLATVAAWTMGSTDAANTFDNNMSAHDMTALLERAKLDDGLLTRADFLEMMLLSMKKVDPELVLALREGFEKVTQGGSIDMTRSQLVNTAMRDVSEN